MIRILSIDGGGIRGIIPAMVLAEIENRTNRTIASLFDLVAGTSTGGILALGLTIPKHPARRLVDLYEREGHRIFSRPVLRQLLPIDHIAWRKYSSAGLEQVLLEYFGDSRLRDAATDVLVTSYEIERRFPFFFKSSNARARSDYDFAACDVARATAAAPTYFAPMKLLTGTPEHHYTLIDGGVFANNPAACALVEARTTHPNAGGYLVVSLGTGSMTRPVPADKAKRWGIAQWAKPILDIVFDGVSGTVDYQMKQLLPDSYYRFQTTLDGHNHHLDNTGADNIASLKNLAADLIEKESESIDALCETLAAGDRL